MSLYSGGFDPRTSGCAHEAAVNVLRIVIPIVIQIGACNREKANRNSSVGSQAIPANGTIGFLDILLILLTNFPPLTGVLAPIWHFVMTWDGDARNMIRIAFCDAGAIASITTGVSLSS